MEALVASVVVTLAVVAVSQLAPAGAMATAVGLVFLVATFLLVWRRDDAEVARHGLAFGGLVLPGSLDVRRMLRDTAVACAFALLAAAIVFVPYAIGFRLWFHLLRPFSVAAAETGLLGAFFGQLVVVALPEEAFYRGYLQTQLDRAWPPRVSVAGARVGLGLVVSSAVFALGHLATVPRVARLAVFFPSLLFGWLRARTGGVGASLLLHALCNVFSEALARGYGAY